MNRVPKIAIIDNSIDPSVYRPVEHWGRHLDAPWRAFTAREGSLPGPAEFSHLILTGSEASIIDRAPWADAEAALVREAVAAGTAVLGSCWGHQLLAFALAGPAHVRRAAGPEIGWIAIRIDRTSDLLGPAGTAPYTFSSHFDEVFDLPPDFEVLASTEACAVEAFRLRGRAVWGLQCHPEIDIDTGLRFCRDLQARGFRGGDAFRKALEGTPRDSGLVDRIVRVFLAAGPTGDGNG
jgi:GMP synthase-like glutamine amidotransferase